MTEVREITRREDIFANSVINSAVIPSAKYSCSESPDRFSSGSTASEWMLTEDELCRVETALWDTAIEQFYADGNEMTNDIQVPPAWGNICWGVWEKVSKRSYRMRHIGWSFDANGTYVGRFYLTATLDMDAGRDTFSGKFVADQEDLSGNFIPQEPIAGTLVWL
jgi:hypothetical protein